MKINKVSASVSGGFVLGINFQRGLGLGEELYDPNQLHIGIWLGPVILHVYIKLK